MDLAVRSRQPSRDRNRWDHGAEDQEEGLSPECDQILGARALGAIGQEERCDLEHSEERDGQDGGAQRREQPNVAVCAVLLRAHVEIHESGFYGLPQDWWQAPDETHPANSCNVRLT